MMLLTFKLRVKSSVGYVNNLHLLNCLQIGSFASPEVIQWAAAVPKTRSGKIMRRILRKIAAKQFNEIVKSSLFGSFQ